MEGVVELAEEIFHMPVRLAMPNGIRGMDDILQNPIFSTGMGLLQYASEGNHTHGGATSEPRRSSSLNEFPLNVVEEEPLPVVKERPVKAPKPVKEGPGVVTRVKEWFKGNF
jgi:cell division protein FtsA